MRIMGPLSDHLIIRALWDLLKESFCNNFFQTCNSQLCYIRGYSNSRNIVYTLR